MKSYLFLIFLIFFFLIACNSSEVEKIEEKIKPEIGEIGYKESLSPKNKALLEAIEGKWTLLNFLDKVYERKAIKGSFIHSPLFNAAIFIEVKDSCILFCGSIYGRNKPKVNTFSKDSLAQITVFKDTFQLYFDESSSSLFLKNQKQELFPFRKLNDNESKYISKEESSHNIFEKGYTSLLHHQLLEGVYQIKNQTDSKVQISKNNIIKGLNEYEKYRIRNWFGTLHWLNEDLIYLRGKNSHDVWAWSFSGKEKKILTLKKVDGLENEIKITNETIVLLKLE